MGGSSSAPQVSIANQGQQNLQGQQIAEADPNLQAALSAVRNGSMSYQDAMNQLGKIQTGAVDPTKATAGDLTSEFQTLAYNDPTIAPQLVNSQVMQQPGMQATYGAGGLQSQDIAQGTTLNNDFNNETSNLASDRQALSGNDPSYGLQDSDLQAYNQAAASAQRQNAASGNSLAQSLADRGLGAAPSGASAAQFSNLNGNNLEQLAGIQNTIAQQRIQTAQSLAQARTTADLQAQGNVTSATGANNAALGGMQAGYQNAYNNQNAMNTGNLANMSNASAQAAGLTTQQSSLAQNQQNATWAQNNATSLSPANLAGGVTSLASAVIPAMINAAPAAAAVA